MNFGIEPATSASSERHFAGFNGAALKRALAFFLPVAVLATLACGLVYLEVQQDQRSGANDPQYQLAQDAAARLDAGAGPSGVVDTGVAVDPSTSLAPFVIIFDAGHSVLAANATLDGGVPVPPAGVLDAARNGSPNAITWQPRAGVRIATVTVAWQWLLQAAVAKEKLAAGAGHDAPFYEGKVCTAEYWIKTELPRIDYLATLCRSGEDSFVRMDPAWY